MPSNYQPSAYASIAESGEPHVEGHPPLTGRVLFRAPMREPVTAKMVKRIPQPRRRRMSCGRPRARRVRRTVGATRDGPDLSEPEPEAFKRRLLGAG